MFSLIITIISIALVAVLALATLYYGGDAFNKGSADAQAAKIVNQGQQLLGAAEMFFVDNKAWPTNVQALIDGGYLKSAPVAYLGNGTVAQAWAAAEWSMPTAGQPVFVADVAASEACQAVNKRTIGLDGILTQAHTSLITQCYGADIESLKAVVSKNSASLLAVDAANPAALPATDIEGSAVPAWDATSGWLAGYTPSSAGATAGGPTTPTAPPASACPLTQLAGWDKLILVNQTATPYTITQWTAYHPYGEPALSGRDPGGNNLSTIYPTAPVDWTVAQSTSYSVAPGYGVQVGYIHGGSALTGTYGAAYIQETDSWCVWGASPTVDEYDVEGAAAVFQSVPGSVWTAPFAAP